MIPYHREVNPEQSYELVDVDEIAEALAASEGRTVGLLDYAERDALRARAAAALRALGYVPGRPPSE